MLQTADEELDNMLVGDLARAQIMKRTLVSSKCNMRVLQEVCSKDVGKGVILLVECEHRTVWSTCASQHKALHDPYSWPPSAGICQGDIRVSATSEHFFSPSPSRNNSNLSNTSTGPFCALCISKHGLFSICRSCACPPRVAEPAGYQGERANATYLSGAFIFATADFEVPAQNFWSASRSNRKARFPTHQATRK